MSIYISLNRFSTRAAVVAALVMLSGLATFAKDLESNIKKTFMVEPGGTLAIEADRGSIDIRTGEHNEVAVEVKRTAKGGSKEKAEQLLADHEVTLTQDGNKVLIRGKMKKNVSEWRSFGRGPYLEVAYIVSVPARFNVDLQTAAGSVSCADLEGTVKARTAGGSLKFGTINGPFDGRTSAGSITLARATGRVSVQTSGGSIDLGELRADTSAETSAGTIKVKAAQAKFTAVTHGGGIEAGELTGPAELKTSAGSITVRKSVKGLKAETSGGSIKIEDAEEAVTAHTSAGSIKAGFSRQPSDDCKLTTSGGGIEVTIADGLGFDLDASASAGRISTDIPVTTTTVREVGKSSLKGKMNGGGKALLLKTSAGSIAIKKAKT